MAQTRGPGGNDQGARIGVLGTGTAGRAIAERLVELGHEVTLGSRDATNPKATAWAARTGGTAGAFADAAGDAEVGRGGDLPN